MALASEPGMGSVPPITVPANGLTRYLRTRLEVSNGELRWQVARTLLGLVPIGVRTVSVPVGQVGSLAVHRIVRPASFAAGVACMAVPVILRLWWVAAPLALVGAWIIAVSLARRSSW